MVIIAGIGMDGKNTVTAEVSDAVRNADILIGAERILECFDTDGKEIICTYKTDEISEAVYNNQGRNTVVLMSGDCGFFSGAKKLAQQLDERGVEYEIKAGISSPVYLCSKAGISWNDVRFVSLHGTKANIVREVCSNEKIFVLLGGENDAGAVCRKLCDYGRGYVCVITGENLGYDNERITFGTAEELNGIVTGKLVSMLIINEHYERTVQSGIADECFVRGKVPMTKSEVRCVCVSKLQINKNDICWDIGSGTGSVSVEMAMRCPEGMVYAVERNEEAVKLSEENFIKFGCDNIVSVHGMASDVSDKLPAPDCVFIGGSGGQFREIVVAALEKNPDVRIVMTAVSLETLAESELIGEREICQMAVTRTEKIGSHTMLRAENPVYIIRRKC